MSRSHGFTLLEILLALCIGLLLITIAIPSVSGMLREQKLKQSFEEFDEFVRQAQTRSVTERRTYAMVWDETGIDLRVADTTRDESEPEKTRFSFEEGAEWALDRPAALVKKPVWEWPFWRSGTCEPVVVHYRGSAGTWSVEYSGLTAQGRFIAMEVK